jgi:predicted GIY-YIG superfamily endonuclease
MYLICSPAQLMLYAPMSSVPCSLYNGNLENTSRRSVHHIAPQTIKMYVKEYSMMNLRYEEPIPAEDLAANPTICTVVTIVAVDNH